MKKSTKEWFKSSESDLLLIKEINSNENLTHLSAFHAQQAIEKSFKAVIEEFNPPSRKASAFGRRSRPMADEDGGREG